MTTVAETPLEAIAHEIAENYDVHVLAVSWAPEEMVGLLRLEGVPDAVIARWVDALSARLDFVARGLAINARLAEHVKGRGY